MINLNFKKIRLEHNLTQKEIAEHLNISQAAYANYEISKREPDFDTLFKIADLYGVTIDYLLGHEKSSSREAPMVRLYTAYISANDNVREAIDKLLGLG